MKHSLVLAAWTSVLLALPPAARAQEPAPTPTPTSPKAAVPRKTTDVTLGLAWGEPTHLTGSFTLMWGRPKMLVALSPGKLVQIRAGARGGQIGVGLVNGAFEDSWIRPSGIGATIKAVAIRTWRDPTGLTDGNTYAGLESDVVILGVRGSVGYARRVGGASGPRGRFVWSIGLGL